MNEKNVATNHELKSILNINREFVKEFYQTKATAEDKKWIVSRMAELEKSEGERKYFAKFRSEFATKFFPELKAAKKAKKKPSLLEELIALDKEG